MPNAAKRVSTNRPCFFPGKLPWRVLGQPPKKTGRCDDTYVHQMRRKGCQQIVQVFFRGLIAFGVPEHPKKTTLTI